MQIHLRPFQESDLPVLAQWCRAIQAEQYMSRTAPYGYLDKALIQSPGLLWYVIEADGLPCGTVWLEKESNVSRTATLGILLGETSLLGKGIGQQAIKLALQAALHSNFADTVRLNVRQSNPRATACYEKCGFHITQTGAKQRDGQAPIPYYEMQLSLKSVYSSA